MMPWQLAIFLALAMLFFTAIVYGSMEWLT